MPLLEVVPFVNGGVGPVGDAVGKDEDEVVGMRLEVGNMLTVTV